MALNWQTASRESSQLAPLPHLEKNAVVQIYTAKAFSWRGKFSVHTWAATKEEGAESYLVYHVLMWGLWNGSSVISISKDVPDRYWYGEKPTLIYSAIGEKAKKIIPQIYSAVNSYPYPKRYVAYPGPNSNSFISHLIRSSKEIKIALPSNAIGKDYLCGKNLFSKFFAISESKTGIQFSIYGLFGITLGIVEGIEINIIALNFGIDFLNLALKLPIIGHVKFFKNRSV